MFLKIGDLSFMKSKACLIFFCFVLMAGGLASQDSIGVEDTLPPPPLNPTLELKTTSVEYSSLSLSWGGAFYPDIVFFSPGSDAVENSYKPILRHFADFLVQNPDVICDIRGYYSPLTDDIDSPSVGRELATRRAMAVREVLLLRQPQLGVKVSAIPQGYDFSSSFLDSAGQFDPRVELVSSVNGWSPRVVVSSPNLPYWRRGFRNIAENEGTKIAEFLDRNPDLNMVFASGLLDISAVEAYNRIETVVSKFRKEMDWKDDSRLVAIHGGNAKNGEMIIDLTLSICGPQPLDRSLLWVQPEDFSASKVDITLGSDTSDDIFAYRIISRTEGRQTTVIKGFGDYPGRAEIFPVDSVSLILPGDIEYSMLLWRSSFDTEQSDWKSLQVKRTSNYYEMATVPIINFVIDKTDPAGHWESSLEPVVRRIEYLANSTGELRLSIIGHAGDFESGLDTLGILRAQYLWKRLADRLIVILGAKDMDDLGKKLTKANVLVELSQEIHTLKTGFVTTLPFNAGSIRGLPPEHLTPWVPFATVKWEFQSHE